MGITNRNTRRVHTSIRLAFGGVDDDLAGEAETLDLSLSGCRASCQSPPPAGTKLQVSLYLPGMEHSISIELAVVRWVRNGRIGIQFCSIPPRHREQLRHWILQPRMEDPRISGRHILMADFAGRGCATPHTHTAGGVR